MKFDKRFWMIAIIILIVATLASAVFAASFKDTITNIKDSMGSWKDKLIGEKGTLKEMQGKYFTMKIIVNTLVIVGVLYILLMIVPSMFPQMNWASNFTSLSSGNTNNLIFFTVIGMLSLIISINVVGPNEYLWEKQWWRDGQLYLLGDDNCTSTPTNEEIANLVKNKDGLLTTTKDPQGNDIKQPTDDFWRKLQTKATFGMVKPAKEEFANLNTQITTLQEEQQQSQKYCYTAESKKSKAERKPNTSPTTDNPLIGWGILRGPRIFILIGSLLLFFLLFKTLSPEMDESVRWILTIMFAAQLAQSGMLKSQFIFMAYWVMLGLLYKTFEKTSGEGVMGRAMACGLTFGVVNTMAASTFPQYGVGLYFFTFLGGAKSFLSNFVAGAIFGYVWASLSGAEENLLKKGFGLLKKGAKKVGGWGGGKLKTAITTIAKGAGKGIGNITKAGIKKARAALRARWGTTVADLKEMQKLAVEYTTTRSNDALYGETHTFSRVIGIKEARYQEYVKKVNNWVIETDTANKKKLEKEIYEIEKEMEKGNYPFSAPTRPTDTNPTYDNNKKNKKKHKSILGIAHNIVIEQEIQNQKDTQGL